MDTEIENKELTLAPGSYAYMQDVSKGLIRTTVGPAVINQTKQDRPMMYDPDSGSFHSCSLLDSVRSCPIAVEGWYLQLLNPAKEGEGSVLEKGDKEKQTPDLLIGRRINMPGPVNLALWPGQAARVIRGHQISRNEYLKVRVYNEEEARKNWGQAIVKVRADAGGEEDGGSVVTAEAPEDLTVGKLFIIAGNRLSFYIPPTGMAVVPDGTDDKGRPQYVREALTLERLEYCVLVDQDGGKRYEIGPQVVFPQPTEQFVRDDKKNRKFRAQDLNKIQGLHIKVIADYQDPSIRTEQRPDGDFKAGDEIFIDGSMTPIYFPRSEHSIVKYDGNIKHFATAVPVGEARYVMDRMSGEINMAKGPMMLLPNPIHEVIVRRVLSPKQAELWYPGNEEVQQFNDLLREAAAGAPTTRSGAVSEGDASRTARSRSRSRKDDRSMLVGASAALGRGLAMDETQLGQTRAMADEFTRKSTYTAPRTITLDKTNFGVPTIQPWTGYAVMVVKKDGTRRVVQGPSVVQLEYDESLEVLELSSGRPKTTDHLVRTVYLRTHNNKVSDIVQVTTGDHVDLDFKLSYVVNFEGEPQKWFGIENYVKFMCDHMRSLLKGEAKNWKIAALYADPSKFVRDLILGTKVLNEDGTTASERPGHVFAANGMRIEDVEILKTTISNNAVASMLAEQQHEVVASNIRIERAEQGLEVTRQLQAISRFELDERDKTDAATAAIKLQGLAREREEKIAVVDAKVTVEEARVKLLEKEEANHDFEAGAERQRDKLAAEQRHEIFGVEQKYALDRLKAEAAAIVTKYQAAAGPLSQAMLTLSDRNTLIQVAQAASAQKLFGGQDFAEAVGKIFENTPLGDNWKRMMEAVQGSDLQLPANGTPPTS